MGTGREGEGVDTDGERKERDSEREGWRKGMEWAGRQRERERERPGADTAEDREWRERDIAQPLHQLSLSITSISVSNNFPAFPYTQAIPSTHSVQSV